MRKRLFVIWCLIGLITVSPASIVLAQPPEGGGPPHEHFRHHKRKPPIEEIIIQELNLTPEQQKQIESHKEKHMEAFKSLMKAIHEKREAVRNELHKTQLDMDEVRKLHAELKSLVTQKEDFMLEGVLNIRKILTPEQFVLFREKLDQFKDKDKEKFKPRFQDDMPMEAPPQEAP